MPAVCKTLIAVGRNKRETWLVSLAICFLVPLEKAFNTKGNLNSKLFAKMKVSVDIRGVV